ncbi:MAG: class I SAM-dependent methyltransferase [Myxococcales bacterium]|nr:class I SAM-dependent methyltransferase [Myxococcales bacterium]
MADAVGARDRTPQDRALDAGRQPGKILAFFQLRRGQRVAELGVGTGTTTELLARVVGPKGRVYGQNPPFVLKRFAEKPWSARLKKAVMKNVVRLDRPFDDPFPASVTKLDAVLNILFYHDTFWQKVDRGKMNKAVFAALKSGGIYGIVDHAAKTGRGSLDTKSLHRVEKSVVIKEIEAAGFVLIAEATFLHNPKDAHDWNAAPRASGTRRGTSDRFVLLFVKP